MHAAKRNRFVFVAFESARMLECGHAQAFVKEG